MQIITAMAIVMFSHLLARVEFSKWEGLMELALSPIKIGLLLILGFISLFSSNSLSFLSILTLLSLSSKAYKLATHVKE